MYISLLEQRGANFCDPFVPVYGFAFIFECFCISLSLSLSLSFEEKAT